MKTIKVTHFEFNLYEEKGEILVKIYNLNAKKEWNRLVGYYRFSTIEKRQAWVDNMIANYKARAQAVIDRRNERKNLVNDFVEGDILFNSWGYDQTNIDFYQVTKVMGKRFIIKPIGSDVKDNGFMCGIATAIKDAFIKDGKEYIATISRHGATSSLGHAYTQYLSRWDGHGLQSSWYA